LILVIVRAEIATVMVAGMVGGSGLILVSLVLKRILLEESDLRNLPQGGNSTSKYEIRPTEAWLAQHRSSSSTTQALTTPHHVKEPSS
jgi:hypothetical protein